MKITDLKSYTVVGGARPVSVPEQQKGLGQQIGDIAQGVSNFIGAKGLTDLAGSQIAKFGLGASGNMDAANRVAQPSVEQVIGSAIQTGANFIPGAGIGAGLAKKVAIGAGTGYAMDVGNSLQQGRSLQDSLQPGIGTSVGGGLPVVSVAIKPAVAILGRLFKGLGSGLSGVSTNALDAIVNNPQKAQEVSKQISKSGGDKILESNARQIIEGVSKIRQEARTAFGEGLQQLKKEDINPTTFRNSIQSFLDANGVSLNKKTNTRMLNGVEFSDPKNLQRASNLIDELSKVRLDGLSLRNLLNKVENTRFKTATSDERLAFNAFTKDMANAIKGAITSSTDKLNQLNASFSQDMQLAETAQNIFGKVNFKNLPEVVKASQKLEGLFAQKGLAPGVVDNFLQRIGVKPSDFRTSEAIRQISGKVKGTNTEGLTIGELTQSLTSAIITPDIVKNISIATGMAKEKFLPFLQSLGPVSRNAVIQALLQANRDSSQ